MKEAQEIQELLDMESIDIDRKALEKRRQQLLEQSQMLNKKAVRYRRWWSYFYQLSKNAHLFSIGGFAFLGENAGTFLSTASYTLFATIGVGGILHTLHRNRFDLYARMAQHLWSLATPEKTSQCETFLKLVKHRGK